MNNLQRELGLTYLFIAHDLSVARHICDRVAVMYVGRIIELAETEQLFHGPKHPYTRSLLDADPVPDPSQPPGDFIEGEVADPGNPPPGCSFHPRCPFAEDRCRQEVPELRQVGDRWVGCHRADELDLAS
jgi:oligopeptide/dipeptide ABC transporter ATP-binding protein